MVVTMSAPETAFESRRPEPETWQDLLASAQLCLDDTSRLQPEAVQPLAMKIEQQDALTLDLNRYFAYTKFFSPLANQLHVKLTDDNDYIEQLIAQGAQAVQAEYRADPKTTAIKDLGETINPLFEPLARKTYTGIGRSIILLTNALDIADLVRSESKRYSYDERVAKISKSVIEKGTQIDTGDQVLNIVGATFVIEQVLHEALQYGSKFDATSSSDVTQLVTGREAVNFLKGMATFPLVVFDALEDVRILWANKNPTTGRLLPVNHQAKRAYIDECQHYLQAKESYDPHFDRTSPILCPALSVPYLFEIMHNLMTRILVRAANQTV